MRLITISALLLASVPASATSTMCTFTPPPTSPVPTLELLGYGKVGPIQVNGRGGPRNLPPTSWKVVDFHRRSARVHIVFTNPGDPSLPPSFTLRGQDRQTRLVVRGQTYTGELRCDL
jgi:hypothetical protein